MDSLNTSENSASTPLRASSVLTYNSLTSVVILPSSSKSPSPFSVNAFIIDFIVTNVLLRLGSPCNLMDVPPILNFIVSSFQLTWVPPKVVNHFILNITSELPNSRGKKSLKTSSFEVIAPHVYTLPHLERRGLSP